MGMVNEYEALKAEQMKLKQDYAVMTRRITARKQALKAYGQSKHYDSTLQAMSLHASEISARLTQIKVRLSQITPPAPVKPEKPEPPCKRPEGQSKEINPHGLFQSMNAWERRLLGLMIAEIGDERYKELKKLAAYDKKYKAGPAPCYSTWVSEPPANMNDEADSLVWEKEPERPGEKKSEPMRFEEFDRMMRSNSNNWF